MSLSITPYADYHTYKITFEDAAGLCAGWFIHRTSNHHATSGGNASFIAEINTRLAAMFGSGDKTVAWTWQLAGTIAPAAFSNFSNPT